MFIKPILMSVNHVRCWDWILIC